MRAIYNLAICVLGIALYSCGDGGHQHGWDKSVEEMAERFNNAARDEKQKPYDVIALFGGVEGKTIVDLGAGTGYFTFKLAEKGANVIAAEIKAEYLEYITETAAGMGQENLVKTRLVPANSPGLSREEADGVLVVDVYHHIENRSLYFAEVFDGLKNGGTLLIVEYNKDRCLEDGPPVERRLTEDQVVMELMGAGFDQVISNNKVLDCQVVYIANKVAPNERIL